MSITIDGIVVPETATVTIDNTQVLEINIDGTTVWVHGCIQQPSNISPSDGATGYGEDCPTLEASDFSVYNNTDTFVGGEWKLVDTGSATTIYQTELNYVVDQPSNLSPSDGATGYGEDCPTLEASDTTNDATFASAEWKIVDTGSNTTVYQQEVNM